MNYSLFVRRGQGGSDLPTEAQDVGLGHLADALDALPQRLAFQKLHRQVGHTARLVTVVEDLDDAGMGDEVGGARFVEEAVRQLGVAGVLGTEDLDGGADFDVFAYSLVHHAHAPFAQGAYEPVFADARADHLANKAL
ncbi:MAG: hypothetical protein QM769_03090 [Pseudoxanthomonas sp.]